MDASEREFLPSAEHHRLWVLFLNQILTSGNDYRLPTRMEQTMPLALLLSQNQLEVPREAFLLCWLEQTDLVKRYVLLNRTSCMVHRNF